MNFTSFVKKTSGQSIIELVAVVAIGTILILALVTLSTRSNRSADSSKARTQAAQLATEGIEVIKSIKSTNGPVYYNTACDAAIGTGYTWSTFFTQDITGSEYTCGDAFGKKGYVVYDPAGGCPNWCMSFNSRANAANVTDITVDNRTYIRQVYVSDTPVPSGKSNCNAGSGDWNKIKQFVVVVTWNDTTGSHEATNSTCLKAN